MVGSPGEMSFFQDAFDLVATTDGRFHATTAEKMLVLVHAFCQQENMRATPAGDASLTMRRDAERGFCANYHLSVAQYACLAELCRGGQVRDVFASYLRSLPPAVQGVRSTFVRRMFAHAKHSCCGSKMRVRRMGATVYGRDECYET